jgi:hypothetical protein
MDVVLAVAIGSVIDFDLSRLCFAKNLDSFEPCGDEEVDEEGVLWDCLPLMENVVDVVEKVLVVVDNDVECGLDVVSFAIAAPVLCIQIASDSVAPGFDKI